MAPLVLFPDATLVVVDHLDAELDAEFGDTVPVYGEVPNPRPDRFVVVRRTGGPRLNLVADDPQLTIESWADLDEDAADLAQECRAIVNAMRGTVVEGVAIYRVQEFSGPANLPDPESAQSRYTQTFTVAMRGTSNVGS